MTRRVFSGCWACTPARMSAASLAGVPVAAVRRSISELARAHLVIEQSPGRFGFHDLLRVYASELACGASAESDPARRRMLDHYLHTAHAGTFRLNPHRDHIELPALEDGVAPEEFADQANALAWFTSEHTILVAAVGRAAAWGFDQHAWQIAWCLTNYLLRLGRWDEQVATQSIALDAALRLDDRHGQANAHRHLGRAHAWAGRYDEAGTHLLAALDLCAERGDVTAQAHLQLDLGMTHERRGSHAEALAHSQRALELFKVGGHTAGQANALNAIGWEYSQLGDHERALAHCRQALTLHREIGDRHAQAGTWDSIAHAHRNLGNQAEAVDCYRQALQLYRDTGDSYYQAEVLGHLGEAYESAADNDSARDVWEQALAILIKLEHPDAAKLEARLSRGAAGPHAHTASDLAREAM